MITCVKSKIAVYLRNGQLLSQAIKYNYEVLAVCVKIILSMPRNLVN